MDKKKPYDRTNKQNLTVYLGKIDVRQERRSRLQNIADEFSDGKISKLIQEIADGKLLVKPPS